MTAGKLMELLRTAPPDAPVSAALVRGGQVYVVCDAQLLTEIDEEGTAAMVQLYLSVVPDATLRHDSAQD